MQYGNDGNNFFIVIDSEMDHVRKSTEQGSSDIVIANGHRIRILANVVDSFPYITSEFFPNPGCRSLYQVAASLMSCFATGRMIDLYITILFQGILLKNSW